MRNLALLLFLSLAFTAGAQTVKSDNGHTKKDTCKCYLMRKDPEARNPYAFADSAKAKKPAGKPKKKAN